MASLRTKQWKGWQIFSSRPLTLVLWGISIAFVLLMVVCFFHGFPIPLLQGSPLRIKNLRKPFEFAVVFFLLGLVIHPQRDERLAFIKKRISQVAGSPWAIWFLAGAYFLFSFWEQVTKHLALELNFIPFLFYDYMLWYFDQAKFCFTGFLHGYYHVNLILLLLYPLWKLVQTPWFLHVAHPLLASLAAVPLYFVAREKLKNPFLAFVTAFIYLNFRYVHNLVFVNFAVEVFYPLFIFSAIYFAEKRWNALYYLSVILGLLVKEDSAFYFLPLGIFFLFSKENRKRGLVTLALAAIYPLWVLKVFLPWSGSTILRGDLNNYSKLGRDMRSIVWNVATHPWILVKEFFLPTEKLETFFKVTSRLLFLPFFSPWILLVIAAIYPLFFQGGDLFIELAFYYSAPVLPFLFVAFVDGWRRLQGLRFWREVPFVRWAVVVALVLLNGLNLRPLHFTRDDLKTISLAKGIPKEAIVLAQGHLLPYLGYRKWNFYFAPSYARRKDIQEQYENPDFYLIDLEANPYPLSPEELTQMARTLKENPRYRVAYEDRRRLLLEKIRG